MSDERVLEMPIRRFWFMQRNIGKLSALNDIRGLRLGRAIGGDMEELIKYRDDVVLELGSVSRSEEKLDRTGLQRLAAMA